MKTIKSLKDITTLEVDDVVVFDGLKYEVAHSSTSLNDYYYLDNPKGANDVVFEKLNINKRVFIEKLGIDANCNCDFPETKSLEALTAIVSALFKEYEKQNKLPKTWEEFCIKNKITCGESYIDTNSKIEQLTTCIRGSISDRNICTSEREAQAFLALMQLRQLRKAYIKNWEPDWMDDKTKCALHRTCDNFYIYNTSCTSCALSFPTYELAEEFLTNFKDLLEIAKPLL